MTNAVPERASIWRESLREFKKVLIAKKQWVAGLVCLLSGLQISAALYPPIQMFTNSVAAAAMLLFVPVLGLFAWQGGGAGVPLIIVSMALVVVISYALIYYSFAVVYLQMAAKNRPPQFSFKNFAYWFGNCFKKYAPFVLLFWLLAFCTTLPHDDAASYPVLIGLAYGILGIGVCYCLIRLILVTPIALFRREPVLENSWNMTKGKFWRIFGNLFMFQFVIACIFLIPWLVAAGVRAAAGHIAGQIVSGLVSGMWLSLGIMTSVVSNCTLYRILLKEQRNTPATIQQHKEQE